MMQTGNDADGGKAMRDEFPVVVHTLLFRGDTLLLLRRAHSGYLDGWYALPGGHLQRGEGIVACAVRELTEETGLIVAPGQLRPAAVLPYRSAGQQGIDFILACTAFDGEPRLTEPERFDAIGWWSVDALPPRTVPYVAPTLAMTRRGDWFFEFETGIGGS
jgi:ADP-ribose pyrophosphatase YjhB (NUDIX family)